MVARRAHNPEAGGSSPSPAICFADIAQLVERILGKDEVSGSNPDISFFKISYGGIAQLARAYGSYP